MKKKFSILLLFGFILPLVILVFNFFMLNRNSKLVDDTYNKIIKRDCIIVGVAVDSKPFGFLDEKGRNVGFDVDIAKRIAQYILKDENKIEFVPVSMSDRMIKLNKGEVDLLIASITITPQRSQVVDFSAPYYIAGQAIMVNKDSKIKMIGDLTGQSVGVVFGTTAEKNARTLLPLSKILGFKGLHESYMALKNRQVNAITNDDSVLRAIAEEDKSVIILPKRYSREPYAIAFRKDDENQKLKEQVGFVLSDLKSDNELVKLMKKWSLD